MQSKLDAVKEMLAYLVNNNIIKDYEIKTKDYDAWKFPILDKEERTTVFITLNNSKELDLPLHSAYWYLHGIVYAQDLSK